MEMTEANVRSQLEYYGVPKAALNEATAYAMELIEDRGSIDLAEFTEAWMAL